MTRTLPMIEARNRLTKLPEEFRRSPSSGAVAVTRRGKPVLALMPWEAYESLVETLEILGHEEAIRALRQAIREIGEGQLIPWEAVKEKLSR